ncbi:hypothetical protein L596_016749 [Steinernema carpocapsae]|uniref:Carboxylesterase type B domain-containing protein n=1 Tax=Steinernema carpocapsae TaxID=34508 RepID=A0A4U5NK77_STECR|nr:hypothetical protein L596_016749 [Steinernema carpocapsae]
MDDTLSTRFVDRRKRNCGFGSDKRFEDTEAIRGRIITTPSGIKSNVFQGIPYAEPPLDILRFKDPELKKPWSGVLRTIACRNNCIYNSSVTPVQMSYDELSEDCLYMKVFTSNNCLE